MIDIRALVLCGSLLLGVYGHGGMVEPPSRSVMHDYGFPDNPRDSNWMEGFCGGKAHQWSPELGGKCGICGDPWDAAVRDHEAPGGRYANGVIVRRYQPGQVITVTSHITANHVGFVEWRLCPNNNIHQDPDQDCFDKEDALLTIVETGDTKFWITDAMGTGKMSTKVRLPMMECEQCVLQWTYRNGRDWGTCNGACGPVETFRACADIAISSDNNTFTTTDEPPTASTSNNHPTTTNQITTATTEDNVQSGDSCKGSGAWEGDASMDDWCQLNCHHDPPFCPSDRCTCEDDNDSNVGASVLTTELTCVSIGLWSGSNIMSQWCQNNCNATPSFCPEDLCQCT